ncbi:MAG: hypothetical protein WAU11_02890 [Ignavibacteriaceae bacterium]
MENLFLSEYFTRLVNYNRIPKLQIERAISPFLSIFIEDLITNFLKNNHKLSGKVEMILPEFPLKKDNNQSTNIDWLLINREKGVLLFVELKTAASSYKPEQLDIYQVIQKNISDKTAGFLYEDIIQIRDNSNEPNKYNYVLDELKPFTEYLNTIRDVVVIYIVPTKTKKQLSKAEVLTFSEFPKDLPTKYPYEWIQVREFLISIDNQIDSTSRSRLVNEEDFMNSLKPKLEKIQKKFNKIPQLIWLGRTGEGSNPNFQIQFTDGSIKPFYSSGKEYTLKDRFDPNKIRGPFNVDDLPE